MRLAFQLHLIADSKGKLPTEKADLCCLELVEVSDHMKKDESIRIYFQHDKEGAWERTTNTVEAINVQNGSIRVLEAQARVLKELLNTLENFDIPGHTCSIEDPCSLIRGIEDWGGGRQVVWDGSRFRNCSTLKEGASVYQAVDYDFTVEAEKDKSAQDRLTKKFAELMAEEPTRCKELSEWFANGRKVKKINDGTAPAFVDRAIIGYEGRVHDLNKEKTKSTKK
jgi:hypothetical protein